MNKSDKQARLVDPEEACVFCQVVKNETKRYPVFEDENSFAFLDLKPLFPGHVLLVPKAHYQEMNEIPDNIIEILFKNVKAISNAIEEGLESDGTFIAINNKVSQSVPHLHIHIVPRKFKDGLKGFFWPRYKYISEDEITIIQQKIIGELK